MVQRQLPQPAELLELLQFKKPELNGRKRRLASALTIADLRLIAKRRTPKAAFDYTDGAAEGELSLARARQAFEDVEFHPSILRPAESVDLSTTILGGPSALPFGIAPTGFTRLMQTEGEIAGASAAGAAGIPFTLSTLGTTSIEDVKAAGLDFGLAHEYTGEFWSLVNRLSWVPLFEDFGNYRAQHESYLELPLADPKWKLRLGVANDFNSEPTPGLEKLDTTYFARLVLSFK